MSYQWDDNKRRSNLVKHGIDFAAVKLFRWDDAAIIRDNRSNEQRFIAYGYLAHRLIAIVFTLRGENIRIISMRKTNSREVKRYG